MTTGFIMLPEKIHASLGGRSVFGPSAHEAPESAPSVSMSDMLACRFLQSIVPFSFLRRWKSSSVP